MNEISAILFSLIWALAILLTSIGGGIALLMSATLLGRMATGFFRPIAMAAEAVDPA